MGCSEKKRTARAEVSSAYRTEQEICRYVKVFQLRDESFVLVSAVGHIVDFKLKCLWNRSDGGIAFELCLVKGL